MFSPISHEKMASSAGELLPFWNRPARQGGDLMKVDFYSYNVGG